MWRQGGGQKLRKSSSHDIRRRFSSESTWSMHEEAPFGLAGGGPGMLGAARVERADGSVQALGATDAVEVVAGDAIVIETPGGGGYGAA
jgi:5-oxoprolinase (ATP-hydrolysing)